MSFRKFIFNLLVLPVPGKVRRGYARNLLDAIFPSKMQLIYESDVAAGLVKYINEAMRCVNFNERQIKSDIVWQYWGQGVENANYLVKCCFNSVDKAFSDKLWSGKIVRADNYVVRELLDIPEHFFDKAEKGANGYSFAALSDLIRCGLLYKYGGIWLDASVFCSRLPTDLVDGERVLFERKDEISRIEKIKYMARSSYFRWKRGGY